MEEGIDRQGIHTFWRNPVSKFKNKKKKGGIHASGVCDHNLIINTDNTHALE
jgi:hypothetical protein